MADSSQPSTSEILQLRDQVARLTQAVTRLERTVRASGRTKKSIPASSEYAEIKWASETAIKNIEEQVERRPLLGLAYTETVVKQAEVREHYFWANAYGPGGRNTTFESDRFVGREVEVKRFNPRFGWGSTGEYWLSGTPETNQAFDGLLRALIDQGWQPVSTGRFWHDLKLRRVGTPSSQVRHWDFEVSSVEGEDIVAVRDWVRWLVVVSPTAEIFIEGMGSPRDLAIGESIRVLSQPDGAATAIRAYPRGFAVEDGHEPMDFEGDGYTATWGRLVAVDGSMLTVDCKGSKLQFRLAGDNTEFSKPILSKYQDISPGRTILASGSPSNNRFVATVVMVVDDDDDDGDDADDWDDDGE